MVEINANEYALRGVSAEVANLRPEFKITQGRMFRSGLREVVVGRAAYSGDPKLKIGAEIEFVDSRWTVVGVFGKQLRRLRI